MPQTVSIKLLKLIAYASWMYPNRLVIICGRCTIYHPYPGTECISPSNPAWDCINSSFCPCSIACRVRNLIQIDSYMDSGGICSIMCWIIFWMPLLVDDGIEKQALQLRITAMTKSEFQVLFTTVSASTISHL